VGENPVRGDWQVGDVIGPEGARPLRVPLWGPVVVLCVVAALALTAYDLYPLLVQKQIGNTERDLRERGATLGEFRRVMGNKGAEIDNIENMNAILIRYGTRDSLIFRTYRNLRMRLSGEDHPPFPAIRSHIIFLNHGLDDNTTVPRPGR